MIKFRKSRWEVDFLLDAHDMSFVAWEIGR